MVESFLRQVKFELIELADFTNAECQLNRLDELVSIVSKLIIQNIKSPKQACR